MEKQTRKNVTKIYCEKCDLIFTSRNEFDKHFVRHSSNITCETCPVDTVIEKFVNLFRRNHYSNLE